MKINSFVESKIGESLGV